MLRPEHYAGGEDDDGANDEDEDDPDDPWIVCGDEYREHPRRHIGEDEAAMLEVWEWSRGGIGGRGYLPEAGGYLDQAARNMDIIAVGNATAAWCDKFISRPKPERAPREPAPRRR